MRLNKDTAIGSVLVHPTLGDTLSNDDVTGVPLGRISAADLGDADLVLRTRSGDRRAFGELWRRHYRAGLTVADAIDSRTAAAELVELAFARIYRSIVTGGGPTGAFRAHLFTSIRTMAAGDEQVDDPRGSERSTAAALDGTLTSRSFSSLPSRWQEVLWYSAVEQMHAAEIAPLLGLTVDAAEQLTARADGGLREAWISAHLNSVAADSDCRWTLEHLGGWSRLELARRDHGKVDAHLAVCARCAIVAGEAKAVSRRLGLVLLPLAAGIPGSTAYAAALQGGKVPILAPAMPAGTMEGADASAIARTGARAGVPSPRAGPHAWSPSPATGTRGGVGRGIMSRIGIGAGLATAGVLVVGAVAAAAVVLPTLAPSSVVAGAPTEAPSIDGSAPAGGQDDTSPRSSPSPSDLPTASADSPPVGGETTDPGTAPDSAVSPTSDNEDPVDPGAGNPSPPIGSTPAQPNFPSGAPAIAGSSSSGSAEVALFLEIAGTPGATVQVRVRGTIVATATVEGSGTTTVTVHPSAHDIETNARVEVRYVAGDRLGPPAARALADLIA